MILHLFVSIYLLSNIHGLLAGNYESQSYSPLATSEITALKELFSATRGYYWTRKDNWLSSPDPCQGWFGIKCGFDQKTGRQTVIEINLPHNNLRGSLPLFVNKDSINRKLQGKVLAVLQMKHQRIPTDILKENIIPHFQKEAELPTAFPNLKVLNLEINMITNSIPDTFGSLKSLEVLKLGTNELSGHLTCYLGKLINLIYLDISRNKFSGSLCGNLSQLINLEYLNINRNNFKNNIPKSFENLQSLKRFEAQGNYLEGELPFWLSKCPKLEHLSFAANDYSGSIPIQFSQFTSLKYLNLEYNSLSGTVDDSLGQIPTIKRIRLHGNQLQEPFPPSVASKLPWFDIIDLNNL